MPFPAAKRALNLTEDRNQNKNLGKSGRSGRIRTCDPCVPNAVLYRAEPHSDKTRLIALGFAHRKKLNRGSKFP